MSASCTGSVPAPHPLPPSCAYQPGGPGLRSLALHPPRSLPAPPCPGPARGGRVRGRSDQGRQVAPSTWGRPPTHTPGRWPHHRRSPGPGSPWCSAASAPCRTPATGNRSSARQMDGQAGLRLTATSSQAPPNFEAPVVLVLLPSVSPSQTQGPRLRVPPGRTPAPGAASNFG